MSRKDGIVRIHGKSYSTVARRVALFRKRFPPESGWAILTVAEELGADYIVMRADIVNPDGRVIATGWARDGKTDSSRHKTSWVEITETSAVGRALAFLDEEFMGDELQIASADEVRNAIESEGGSAPQQSGPDKDKLFADYMTRIEQAVSSKEVGELGKGIDKLPLAATAKQALHKVCAPRFKELKDAEESAPF